MEFFEAVQRRRSVRIYRPEALPEAVVQKSIDAAILAPNSSNMQTMKIIRVRTAAVKARLAEACLGQKAASTAPELFVFVADAGLWKRNVRILRERFKDDGRMNAYYSKLMPLLYGWRWLAPLKWLIFNGAGLFRPTPRHPWSARDVDEIAIKSTALACENFMLAMAAQGYDTCPMEGFDECRVRRLLRLRGRARVVMVISAGLRDEKGIWGDQFRLDRHLLVEEI